MVAPYPTTWFTVTCILFNAKKTRFYSGFFLCFISAYYLCAETKHRLSGVICIYLFIAQAIPGAFNGVEQMLWYDNFANIAYYSFVTLTTLGYGDISPVAPIARFLVYIEAVVGVFYMAILVASLIGVGINEAKKN